MENQKPATSRKDFIQASAATGAIAALAATGNYAYAQGSNRLKIGLVGCGGRGSGAAVQALTADPENVLVAMGDVRRSQIESSLANIKGEPNVGSRAQVDEARRFEGLDAYLKVLDSGIDVVLLASPPGFRPREVKAAVAAGKHIFAEKPMGTDAVNARMAWEAAKGLGKKQGFLSGFCWRYDYARREFFKRIHAGAIGQVRHVHATYLTSPVKPMPPADSRPAGMSDVEWQIRNWYNFCWLSGDGLVEQACHSVDKIMWAYKDVPPAKCVATGGRTIPNNEGNIWDHITVFYEWADGSRATMAQRQIDSPHSDNSDFVNGSSGVGSIKAGKVTIQTDKKWVYDGKEENMYQVEHNEFFASIRQGQPLNNSERMARSTLVGLMGRMAAYSGQEITWEQVLRSQDNIFPEKLEWNGSLPITPLPVPGQYRLR
jgi:predicted dehydrogenase